MGDPISILVVVIVIFLLIFAIVLILKVHVCDFGCKALDEAKNKAGNDESIDYYIYVLNEIGKDGIWPIAFIGSMVITLIFFWAYKNVEWDVRNLFLCFFLSFITIYFCFSFYIHHNIVPLRENVSTYIQKNRDNVFNIEN